MMLSILDIISAMCFAMYGFSVRAANDNALRKLCCASKRDDSTCCDSAMLIPVSDYSANNKTVSDEIRKEYKSTYQNNVVVVSFSLFVRETTQCILPYSPEFNEGHTSELLNRLLLNRSDQYK